MNLLRKTTMFFLLLFLMMAPGKAIAEDAVAREEARRIYGQGISQLTLYHLSLDRSRLADAIRFFKDAVATDLQYSRAYYALVASLEEFEAGSAERLGDSLRELVENLFDPFSSGAEAASDMANLELMGVCMERLRRLALLTAHVRTHGGKLSDFATRPPHCPLDGEYTLREDGSRLRASCSLHGEPLGPAEDSSEAELLALHLQSEAYRAFANGVRILASSVGESSAEKLRQRRQEAAREFLRGRRLAADSSENHVGLLNVLAETGLTPAEQQDLTAHYRALLKDPRQKRYARHAAGELLDLEYARRCHVSRLLLQSALEMYALDDEKADPDTVDRAMLKQKGYLKQEIGCPRGGTLKASGKKGSIRVECSVHR